MSDNKPKKPESQPLRERTEKFTKSEPQRKSDPHHSPKEKGSIQEKGAGRPPAKK